MLSLTGVTLRRGHTLLFENATFQAHAGQCLGLVGAGGIGLQLQASLNVLAWPQVSLILLVILVAVIVSEWISAKIRGAII